MPGPSDEVRPGEGVEIAPDPHHTSHQQHSMRALALSLRFLLELAMLGALVYGAVHAPLSTSVRTALAVAAPLAAALAWGRFVAPRARRPLSWPVRLAVEALMFGAAAFALRAGGRPRWALMLVGLTIVDELMLAQWDPSGMFRDGRP